MAVCRCGSLSQGTHESFKAHPLFLFWGETNPREFHDGPKEAAPQHSALRRALLTGLSSVLASELSSRIIWSCWTIKSTKSSLALQSLQPQTVAASFHMAASSASDNFRILKQVSEGYRIVASLPVNADQPEKSRGGLRGIMKHSPNRNGHGDSLAYLLVQDGQHWSRHLVLRHCLYLLLSFGGAKLWK